MNFSRVITTAVGAKLAFSIKTHFTKNMRSNLKGKFKDNADKVFQKSSPIVERFYKLETPRDRGRLRSNVHTENRQKLSYEVTTDAKNNGYNYAMAVAGGTGRYRGSRDLGITTGRVRETEFYGFGNRNDMEAAFASMRINGVRIAIRPNKFPKRAKKKAEPEVFKFVKQHIPEVL